MNIPKSFMKLSLGFRQGTLEFGISENQLIQDSIDTLTPDERSSAKMFLSELLDRNPNGSEIQSIWNNSSASYYVSDDKQLRSLLQLVLIKLK
jgi:hypothetical protein